MNICDYFIEILCGPFDRKCVVFSVLIRLQSTKNTSFGAKMNILSKLWVLYFVIDLL